MLIYFENNYQKVDPCSGQKYYDFLDYAFSVADFFMLVYVNYYGKGYSKIIKKFIEALKPYKVKSRTNPSWPGTLGTYSLNTTYKVVFYRTSTEAKEVLKNATGISFWSSPSNPQDLAFFKGNLCWFYSVGHENIAAIIHATQDDLDFVESLGLALKKNAKPTSEYYSLYDEPLLDTFPEQ